MHRRGDAHRSDRWCFHTLAVLIATSLSMVVTLLSSSSHGNLAHHPTSTNQTKTSTPLHISTTSFSPPPVINHSNQFFIRFDALVAIIAIFLVVWGGWNFNRNNSTKILRGNSPKLSLSRFSGFRANRSFLLLLLLLLLLFFLTFIIFNSSPLGLVLFLFVTRCQLCRRCFVIIATIGNWSSQGYFWMECIEKAPAWVIAMQMNSWMWKLSWNDFNLVAARENDDDNRVRIFDVPHFPLFAE